MYLQQTIILSDVTMSHYASRKFKIYLNFLNSYLVGFRERALFTSSTSNVQGPLHSHKTTLSRVHEARTVFYSMTSPIEPPFLKRSWGETQQG